MKDRNDKNRTDGVDIGLNRATKSWDVEGNCCPTHEIPVDTEFAADRSVPKNKENGRRNENNEMNFRNRSSRMRDISDKR